MEAFKLRRNVSRNLWFSTKTQVAAEIEDVVSKKIWTPVDNMIVGQNTILILGVVHQKCSLV